MKSSVIILLFFILTCIIISGCKVKTSDELREKEQGKEQEQPEEKKEITLSPVAVRRLNEDAILEMDEPGEYRQLPAGKTLFNFEATNFRLGNSGNPSNQGNLAIFASGRHITLILNNELHLASSQTTIEFNLKPGHYVALSFLTEPDYISLKNPDVYVLRQFTAGNVKSGDIDLTGPNIFYHRPSGSLAGPETRNVLLDFYLVNCMLSQKGFHVKVSIAGKTFMIHDWTPCIIHNLPYGENTIKLELLDENGKPVNSPYPSATGKILLYEKEPV
jgi:hypothetical protein